MQRGDLSNRVVPRLVVVWENLVALPPTRPGFRIGGRRFGRRKAMIDSFEPNDLLRARLWDVTFRLDYQVEAVTWLSEDDVPLIKDWIDRHDMPISDVFASDPDRLARRIVYMPQIAAIYDPDPEHQFKFGGKGRITSPAAPVIVGAF